MYVDAYLKKSGETEVVRVVERVDGQRVYKEYPSDYHFYVSDPRGAHRTIFGNSVKRFSPDTYNEKKKLLASLASNAVLWESDCEPVVRALEQNYQNANTPKLNVAFIDIETAFDKDTGYSAADVALNPIISVAVRMQWLDECVCIALAPKTYTMDEATAIGQKVGNVLIVDTESELLQVFLKLIDDADVISGWNSEAFDLPYLINRVMRVLGKSEARQFCLWDKMPDTKKFERGGKEQVSYGLFGRVHIDYLELYKKYSYEEHQSYKLDNIAEAEINERKVDYDGTLDELYHDDFELFLRYNIQDTDLLDKMDKKLKYIDLANNVAHANCVLLPVTMGTVGVIDQAVTIEAHTKGLVVPNRNVDNTDTRAAGGWVAQPKKGLHKWVGSTDMNSLYPSVIRALNMSPETIVGQITLDETNASLTEWFAKGVKTRYTFAAFWNDKFNVAEMEYFYNKDTSKKLTLKLENGKEYIVTGAELHELIFANNSKWCISANGTIFTTEKEGVISGLLTRWYAERKDLQKKLKQVTSIVEGFEVPEGLVIPSLSENRTVSKEQLISFPYESFVKLLTEESDDLETLSGFLSIWCLEQKDNKIVPIDSAIHKWEEIQEHWDKRQHVKKILLNSAYGALLNIGSRFFDQRIGQSTTLTGRTITRHMAAKTNECITGEYDYQGGAIIYGDTDSEVGSTLHKTSKGVLSIEELFSTCPEKWNEGDKEYAYDDELMVMSYDEDLNVPYFGHIEYIYRHKVSKDLYEIEDEYGNTITVTEDHSVMIERDGILCEVKPADILDTDVLISIVE